jgi:hypothetical protein
MVAENKGVVDSRERLDSMLFLFSLVFSLNEALKA